MLLGACGGGGGGGNQSQLGSSPPQSQGGPLSISGTPVTLSWEGDTYFFRPRVTASGNGALRFSVGNLPSWANFDAATGGLYGVPGSGDVGTYTDIGIRVTDGVSESELPSFDLRIEPVSHGAAMLVWTPPSQNTDNSPLTDLVGFKIYGGQDPLALAEYAYVDSAGISSYLLDGLSPGKHYFASAAINAVGVESDLSNVTVIRVR
jgi:hypothetical protein